MALQRPALLGDLPSLVPGLTVASLALVIQRQLARERPRPSSPALALAIQWQPLPTLSLQLFPPPIVPYTIARLISKVESPPSNST